MKSEEKIIPVFLENTYTHSGLHYRIGVLKEFLEDVFFVKKESPNKAQLEIFLDKRKEDATVKESLLTLPEDIYSVFTEQNLYVTLKRLESQIESIPVLNMYTPAVFQEEHTSLLGKWIRKNIGKEVILSLKINPKTAGGCAFVWGGEYYDFSFSYFFNRRKDSAISLIREKYGTFAHNT